ITVQERTTIVALL
nr:immunoglobulin heavy chain junction region [Mus musculus]